MKNTPSNTPCRRSPEQWRELIEYQRAGKQSARAFCQARGIAYSTFLYHKRKLRETAVDWGNEEATAQALAHLQGLYRIEAEIREQQLEGIDKLTYRATHAKPRVDAFFAWVDQQCHHPNLLPKTPWPPR